MSFQDPSATVRGMDPSSHAMSPPTEMRKGRLRTRLRALIDQQQQLADAREQLLIDREDFSSKAKRIREQRVQTGDVEVTLMNALRRRFNELGSSISDDLLIIYARVEEEHLKLRGLEEDHLQAEEDLGASEWACVEMENELYQYCLPDLLSDDADSGNLIEYVKETLSLPKPSGTISPSLAVQYKAMGGEYDRLIKRFEAVRRQKTIKMETYTQLDEGSLWPPNVGDEDVEMEGLYGNLLMQIMNLEVRMQQLKAELRDPESSMPMENRGFSEPNRLSGDRLDLIEPSTRAHSEGARSEAVNDILYEDHINVWSLDRLKQSAIEKMQYLQALRYELDKNDISNLHFQHWQNIATHSWSSGTADLSTLQDAPQPMTELPLRQPISINMPVNEAQKDNTCSQIYVHDDIPLTTEELSMPGSLELSVANPLFQMEPACVEDTNLASMIGATEETPLCLSFTSQVGHSTDTVPARPIERGSDTAETFLVDNRPDNETQSFRNYDSTREFNNNEPSSVGSLHQEPFGFRTMRQMAGQVRPRSVYSLM
jgi:hypothetical protein